MKEPLAKGRTERHPCPSIKDGIWKQSVDFFSPGSKSTSVTACTRVRVCVPVYAQILLIPGITWMFETPKCSGSAASSDKYINGPLRKLSSSRAMLRALLHLQGLK